MTPTAAQADQAAVVHVEVLELFARLEKEGVSWQVALSGASAAIASVVSSQIGQSAVPGWFALQASIAASHA